MFKNCECHKIDPYNKYTLQKKNVICENFTETIRSIDRCAYYYKELLKKVWSLRPKSRKRICIGNVKVQSGNVVVKKRNVELLITPICSSRDYPHVLNLVFYAIDSVLSPHFLEKYVVVVLFLWMIS